MGSEQNVGIMPRVLQELYQQESLLIRVSILEIYNEKVQDLLVDINHRAPQGLKVREHKQHGIFIQGLTKYHCQDYLQVLSIIYIYIYLSLFYLIIFLYLYLCLFMLYYIIHKLCRKDRCN